MKYPFWITILVVVVFSQVVAVAFECLESTPAAMAMALVEDGEGVSWQPVEASQAEAGRPVVLGFVDLHPVLQVFAALAGGLIVVLAVHPLLEGSEGASSSGISISR